MYHKQLLTILLAGVIITSHAQTNSLQFGAGYQHTHLLDQQASPLLYQTDEKTFTGSFTHQLAGAQIQVQLNGSIGSLYPKGLLTRQLYDAGYNSDGSHTIDSSYIIGTFYNARFQFEYSKQLSTGLSTLFGKKITHKNYFGAILHDQLFYTDNIVRVGWLNSLSLNANFEQEVVFNERHVLMVKASVPLVALNTRLPYHNTISSPEGDNEVVTFFKGGSRFASLADYQNVQLTAGYQYKLNKKLGIGIQYAGQWLHYKYVKPIKLYQNGLTLSAIIHY